MKAKPFANKVEEDRFWGELEQVRQKSGVPGPGALSAAERDEILKAEGKAGAAAIDRWWRSRP